MTSGSNLNKGGFLHTLKGMKPRIAIALGAVGVLLMLVAPLLASEGSREADISSEDLIADACSRIMGAGECEAFIRYDSDGEVAAVIIDCESADAAVRADMRRLVADFFGIGINRVSVI